MLLTSGIPEERLPGLISILGVKPRPVQARSRVFGLLATLMGNDNE